MSGDPFNITNIDVESDLRRELDQLREAYDALYQKHERTLALLAKAEHQIQLALATARDL